MLRAMVMTSVLSMPIRGRTAVSPSRACCSTAMFWSVWEATWPKDSPVMTPVASMVRANRDATLSIIRLHRTQWSLSGSRSLMAVW